VVGSCEHGNEPSGYIKDVKFLDNLTDSLTSPLKALLYECI
jgi:hypothetical protein